MAARTRSRVSMPTPALSLSTAETVALDTPVWRATSEIVGRLPVIRLSVTRCAVPDARTVLNRLEPVRVAEHASRFGSCQVKLIRLRRRRDGASFGAGSGKREAGRGKKALPGNGQRLTGNSEARRSMTPLATIDYLLMIVYFAVVLTVGWMLRRSTKTSTDFFLSGRSIPSWVAGLAFISANLGAQEVIGMGASGAKYGISTAHFYWIGAIPAMVFVGLFMMPFYYGSRARSVPEYLKLRFDEKTRSLNAISFAVMTIMSSGISMYAMGKLFNLLLGWSFDASMIVAALIVLAYIFLGGLTSAIYNEVLQFFLIVFGFAPLVFLGLRSAGGWSGLKIKLAEVAVGRGFESGAMTHAWRYMGDSAQNPIGVEWFGLAMGLGFVLSFGYWCTELLVAQRGMDC